MSGDTQRMRESGWLFLVWWLVWVATLAVPATILGFALPMWLPYVVIVAAVLALAFPPYACGLEWDDPR